MACLVIYIYLYLWHVWLSIHIFACGMFGYLYVFMSVACYPNIFMSVACYLFIFMSVACYLYIFMSVACWIEHKEMLQSLKQGRN